MTAQLPCRQRPKRQDDDEVCCHQHAMGPAVQDRLGVCCCCRSGAKQALLQIDDFSVGVPTGSEDATAAVCLFEYASLCKQCRHAVLLVLPMASRFPSLRVMETNRRRQSIV
jgi:hypothetical protein